MVPAVYADNEIDMNLSSSSPISSNTEDASNETANTSTNTSSNSTSNLTGATVSSVQNGAETELGITGIINILLITVGVILIFLAIAILIRLK